MKSSHKAWMWNKVTSRANQSQPYNKRSTMSFLCYEMCPSSYAGRKGRWAMKESKRIFTSITLPFGNPPPKAMSSVSTPVFKTSLHNSALVQIPDLKNASRSFVASQNAKILVSNHLSTESRLSTGPNFVAYLAGSKPQWIMVWSGSNLLITFFKGVQRNESVSLST